MSVECPEEIFQQLKEGCGGDVELQGEISSFVYDALFDVESLGDSAGSFCVEIHSNNKKLFLIYEDPDAFGLGHADKIKVVKSLDNLYPDTSR